MLWDVWGTLPVPSALAAAARRPESLGADQGRHGHFNTRPVAGEPTGRSEVNTSLIYLNMGVETVA
jgi:hypothetical protein